MRRWYRYGLISAGEFSEGWNETQLEDIRTVKTQTARGATLLEIRKSHQSGFPLHSYGWSALKGELLWQLEFGTDRALSRYVRTIMRDYSSNDVVNSLLRPVNRWLQEDTRDGAIRRLRRFHQCVVQRAGSLTRSSRRSGDIPLFLEAISVKDDNEIWLEAIRLAGQGFSVDVSSTVTNTPVTISSRHEHHVMWCGAGISAGMQKHFSDSIADGKSVMLCGPDCNLTH
ncbi:transcriptional regulator [Superficieibacter electus]|uniref:Transcriptional regulator n=1 Tax=Superficieibacter electus TaxID=2022662 RepID=A0A2P5GTN9_9ENTR|nr:transcriptional regulator [Superficieibacter electus]POP49926.1 transcriptional regulator [Superficieibacter electus]